MESSATATGSVSRSQNCPGAQRRALWYIWAVTLRSAIARCFALLAIIGLVLSPMMRPAMATPAGMPASAGVMAGMVEMPATGMPAGMPCCPGKPTLPDCGKDCPFMALCAGMALSGPVFGFFIPLGLASVVVPGNQSHLVGIWQAPPRRPPKI
jgi:hypothetical protein